MLMLLIFLNQYLHRKHLKEATLLRIGDPVYDSKLCVVFFRVPVKLKLYPSADVLDLK